MCELPGCQKQPVFVFETKNWLCIAYLGGHLRKHCEGMVKWVRKGKKANKVYPNRQLTTVDSKSLALLGAVGTMQNTPKHCPFKEHRSLCVPPPWNHGAVCPLLTHPIPRIFPLIRIFFSLMIAVHVFLHCNAQWRDNCFKSLLNLSFVQMFSFTWVENLPSPPSISVQGLYLVTWGQP